MRAALLVIYAAACSSALRIRRQETEEDASEELEVLLDPGAGYNIHERPKNNESESEYDPISINLSIHVSEVDAVGDDGKEFKISITLRQNWIDERLTFSSSDGAMAVLERSRIWIPSLSYAPTNANGPFSNVMETTPSNDPLSVSPEGDVQYDIDLALKFTCPSASGEEQSMYRVCSFTIASLVHNTDDINLVWDSDYAVTAGSEVSDPHRPLLLPGYRTGTCNNVIDSKGKHSCVYMSLLIGLPSSVARTALEAYLPLGVLVLMTDLSLWCPAGQRFTRLLIACILFLSTVLGAVLIVLLTPNVQDTLALKCWAATCVALADLPLIAIAVTLCRERCRRTISTGEDDKEDEEAKCHFSCCAWIELSYLERATAILLPAALLLICIAFWLVLRVAPTLPTDIHPLNVISP